MDHGPAFSSSCEKRLGDPVDVVRNHRIRDVEDSWGGTVVLVEDDVRLGGELYEHRGLGASPFIDALVRVTHDEKVPVSGGELFQEIPVIGVAVLRLVDHYVVELLLPLLPRILEMVQDVDREVHQGVEIQ